MKPENGDKPWQFATVLPKPFRRHLPLAEKFAALLMCDLQRTQGLKDSSLQRNAQSRKPGPGVFISAHIAKQVVLT